MFFKIGVSKNFAIFTGKQVFSCEYCEILKIAFFYRTSPMAASEDQICWINTLRMSVLVPTMDAGLPVRRKVVVKYESFFSFNKGYFNYGL